jgi:hypothetical protein
MEQCGCNPQRAEVRHAFETYLRTGRRPIASIEYKFNPNHDPRNGQFTFGPGGSRESVASGTLGRPKRSETGTASDAVRQAIWTGSRSTISAEQSDRVQLAQYRPNPRARPGGNSGAVQDPMTLHQVFPGLASAPGGAIIALADNFLDLTGPANQMTAELLDAQRRDLVRQMKDIDPSYRHEVLAEPTTNEGRLADLNTIRFHRAASLYRLHNQVDALQVETLRFAQDKVDQAYDQAIKNAKSGRLKIEISNSVAIGNYIDRVVRRDLRAQFDGYGIDRSTGRVRVIGREYESSGTDRTYRIPDARVGDIAFDVTLERKTLAKAQIRGFFRADFKPSRVIIIRPSQLGPGNTYIITTRDK